MAPRWSAPRSASEKTPTQWMPISRAVRATRIAISPRFAIRSRRNIGSPSQRDVPVFLGRSGLPLRAQHGERVDDAWPGLRRLDHVVQVAHAGGDVRVCESIAILEDEFLLPFLRFLRFLDFFLEDDLHRAFRTHDGELRRGPCGVEVATDVLRTHDVVRSAVRLPSDRGHLRDRRLAVRVQELRAVPDDPAVLLRSPRQQARDIDERQEGEVEAIAEADETGRLDRGCDVQGAREHLRLIADDPDRVTVEAGRGRGELFGPTPRGPRPGPPASDR